MGVYRRKESPYWHVWIDGAPRPRVNTKIPIGETEEEQRESRALAKKVYHTLMADAARRRFRLPRAVAPRKFADQRAWYAEHVSALKRGKDRELSMLKQLGAYFDTLPLDAIDQKVVREWRTWRKATVSASTIRREEALLKHLLATAVPDYLESNPLHGMQRIRVAETDTRVLSRDEEARLLAALETDVDRAVVLCALDTLLRLSNVRQLQRKQDHGRYLFSDTKAGAVRIPVSDRLRAALDALPGDAEHYFPAYAVGGNNPVIAVIMSFAKPAMRVRYPFAPLELLSRWLQVIAAGTRQRRYTTRMSWWAARTRIAGEVLCDSMGRLADVAPAEIELLAEENDWAQVAADLRDAITESVPEHERPEASGRVDELVEA